MGFQVAEAIAGSEICPVRKDKRDESICRRAGN